MNTNLDIERGRFRQTVERGVGRVGLVNEAMVMRVRKRLHSILAVSSVGGHDTYILASKSRRRKGGRLLVLLESSVVAFFRNISHDRDLVNLETQNQAPFLPSIESQDHVLFADLKRTHVKINRDALTATCALDISHEIYHEALYE